MESLKSLEWELGGQWTDLWGGGHYEPPKRSGLSGTPVIQIYVL